MATKYATSANTAWSLQVWKDAASGGNVVSAPGAGDIADLNGKAVLFDVDITCQQIQSGAAGGYFDVTSHRSITCDVVNVGYGTWMGYVNSGSLTITGNLYSTGSGARYGILNYATLTVNGAITSSNSGQMVKNAGGYGILLTVNGSLVRTGNHTGDCIEHSGAASTLVVNGAITSTSTGSGYCIRGTNTAGLATNAVTVNGNITGGLCVGSGGGVWVINGDISSSMYSLCCDFIYGHTTTINGDITALVGASGYMVNGSSYGHLTVNGDVRNNATTGTGYALLQYGTTVINGDVYPPLTATDNSGTIMIVPTAAGPLTVNGTVFGSDFGYGSTMANGFALHYSSNTARPVYPPRVKHAQSGALGMPICNGPWLMLDNTADTIRWKSPTGWRQFQDEASLESDYPEESDVRLGVDYQFGNLTGTCAVPAAGSVALGVAVDATTGTAVLTAANVTAAIDDAIADAIASIAGSGPNQVDVIVSSSAGGTVQGVSVRIKATGLGDHTATTNSSGVARFNLPSGTWNLTASLNGYSYSGSTQVISTNPQEVPITMTVTSVSTPSSPSKSVGVLLCLDTSGDPESGVTVSFQMVAGPGDDGYSLDAAIVEEDCDSEGVLEREFLRGATYDAWRGVRGARVRFVVPDTASFNLPEQLGVD